LAWGERQSQRPTQHLAIFDMPPQAAVASALDRVGKTTFSLWFQGHGRQTDDRFLDI